MAKKLAIITWDNGAADLYARQVSSFFGGDLQILTYSAQTCDLHSIPPADVYLVSTCAFSDCDINQILPSNSKIVISEVHITRKGLSKLMGIPRKTEALLVNINQPMATETIAMLNQLGVSNIRFTAYYPGAPEPPHVGLAVTTGERRYVPDWVEEVIDLGPRLLSGNTFIALAFHLKQESILSNPEFLAYLSTLAEGSNGIEQVLQRSVQIQSLTNLFQQTQDAGIIGLDKNCSIFFCSPKASEILEVPVEQLFGDNFQDQLPAFPFAECLAKRKTIRNRLVEYHGKQLNVNIEPFYQKHSLSGCFCMFQQIQPGRMPKPMNRPSNSGHFAKYSFESLIGQSAPMVNAKALAKKMAASKAAILITGESGTGKELFAHAIHNASPRAPYPFVAINCAAIPDSLLESQLFGYEEGAFTGAKKQGQIGFFEMARNGSLFLDEIEAMSPILQVKFLRVLQEKEIVRLGGVDVIHVDVRIIAASNESLSEAVREGKFRKDLFYRLNVLPLQLPPLRERGNDIHLLFDSLKQNVGGSYTLSEKARQALLHHTWEGNVRELINCVEYLGCLDKTVIEPEDLPFVDRRHRCTVLQTEPVSQPQQSHMDSLAFLLRKTAGREYDKYLFVLRQLQESGSQGRKNLSETAAQMGMVLPEQSIRTIVHHLQELNLVQISRGRGGTQITQEGMELVNWLVENPIINHF